MSPALLDTLLNAFALLFLAFVGVLAFGPPRD